MPTLIPIHFKERQDLSFVFYDAARMEVIL